MPRDTEPDVRGEKKPKLSRRDVFLLMLRTYWVSLPYLLIFVLTLLVATWVITTVFY